jgi:hypothetical protein
VEVVHASLLIRTDDSFDDNADDSRTPNNAHNSPKTDQSCLFSDLARSWQLGGYEIRR